MKKILLSIIYFLSCIFYIKAQTLYGTTLNGGDDGAGTIIKFIPATNDLTVAKSFESLPSTPYFTNFIEASNGKLYGMTYAGGSNDAGVIFSFDPSSHTYTKLKNFDVTNGSYPFGSLMQASDGKLYGMTRQGGSSNDGVIFSFNPSDSIYTKLVDFDFDNANGSSPEGGLMQASNGKLYGMTHYGGSTGNGVIFSIDPSTSTYTKLKDFDNANGGNPNGSLIQASDGNLYGMTNRGGSSDAGVIFSFDPSTSAYTKLKDFDYTYGNPDGSLIQANDGKLYGMATGVTGGSSSAGVIFSFDPSSSTYTVLKGFDNTSNGSPSGSLMQAKNGKLYGMTTQGGSSDAGVIFSFNPPSSIFTKLKDFDYFNGGNPNGSLMQASDGNLYGMTSTGGITGLGVIFSFDPLSSTYTKLEDFGVSVNGKNPIAGLILATGGKLYGMATPTFSHGGVIFSFDPSSSTFTKLKDLYTSDGDNPYGSLMQASDGKLYGMTIGGGNGDGVIFSFDPAYATYIKLKDFDGTHGRTPEGNLMQASDGRLYGMTYAGGSNNAGVIFSFDPASAIYTKLKDFDGANGGNPYGSLIQASDGKLYGMTYAGGSNDAGVIFSFDPSNSTFINIKDFDYTNGRRPYGSLIEASDGRLYGMTGYGGSSDSGVIFSFDRSTSTYTKLKDFDNANGGIPNGSLIQAGDGKLYGMTYQGGSSGAGVIFSFDPASSTYAKLQDFDNVNGAHPFRVSFIEVPESGPVPVTLISFTGKNNGINNQLSWKVESEQNLNYYELQRSIDGQNFTGISQIKAVGNSIYSYNDLIAPSISSLYYYRLKSVDNDGKFKYSTIIKITPDLNGKFIIVNPNPFKDRLMVTIESLIQDKAIFIITDISGRKLYKEINLLSPGTNVVQINETRKLSKGTYLLTIITSWQSQTITVIKGN